MLTTGACGGTYRARCPTYPAGGDGVVVTIGVGATGRGNYP